MDTNNTQYSVARDVQDKKSELLRLLKEDMVIRDEVKKVIRDRVRNELIAFGEDTVPTPNINSVVENLFPGAQVTTWKCNDPNGIINGTSRTSEIPVISTPEGNYVCLLKNVCMLSNIFHSFFQVVTPEDVLELVGTGQVYNEQHAGSHCFGLIVTRAVSPKAREMAQTAHIDILLAH